MYDPEFDLWVESLLKQIYTATENIRNMVGENHPIIELCEAFDDALGAIEQMRNDRDNCFDETEREVISNFLCKAIDDLTNEWDKVAQLYESK